MNEEKILLALKKYFTIFTFVLFLFFIFSFLFFTINVLYIKESIHFIEYLLSIFLFTLLFALLFLKIVKLLIFETKEEEWK